VQAIPLTEGKETIVDDDVYEYLTQWRWSFSRLGYAIRYGNGTIVYMHRVVAQTPLGMDTDHINGNKLDNRHENLRACTTAENSKNARLRKDNKSGFKGVHWNKTQGRYQVNIRFNGRKLFLGYFDDIEKAALAYDEKARELHGRFARTNY